MTTAWTSRDNDNDRGPKHNNHDLIQLHKRSDEFFGGTVCLPKTYRSALRLLELSGQHRQNDSTPIVGIELCVL